MATAFSIVGDLLLKTGSFVTDTQRAEKSLKSLKQQAVDFKTVFAGSFVGGLAVGAVKELTRELLSVPGALSAIVKEAGHLQDVSEQIGVAADEIGGLTVALAVAGKTTDDFAEFSTKLTKVLSKTDEESDNAAKALAALGIPLEEFKKLDPVTQVERLAKALAGFNTGPEQTAVLEGLVKGGSQLLPFLKELEAQGGRQKILTAEQIKQADDYADRQARSAATLKSYVQVIATDALPALTALQNVFGDVIKGLIQTSGSSSSLTRDNAIQEWAKDAALFLAALVDDFRKTAAEISVFAASTKSEFANLVLLDARAKDALTRLSTLNFKDASGDITKALDARNQAVADANKALLAQQQLDGNKFQRLVAQQFDVLRRQETQRNATTDPRSTLFQQKQTLKVPNFATGGAKDDPTKKLLDNELKAIEAQVKREQELLSDRNAFLNLINGEALVSIKDFYDQQAKLSQQAADRQSQLIDQQIEALIKFRDAPTTSRVDEADAQGKINDLIEKRGRLEEETFNKGIALSFERAKAEKQFADQIKSVNASILELQGNLGAAAAIRFDLQNAQLLDRANVEGNEALKQQLIILRQSTIAQAEFSKAQTDAQRVTETLSITEDRINISRQVGAINDLTALKRVGEARQAAIPQLQAAVQAAEDALSKSPENPALIQNVERLRLELERLKAEADPLGDKFRTIFEDAAATGIETFIDDVRKGKDAVKAFADSAVQQINRLVSQNLAQSLFGTDGALGGVGSFFGQIFGGKSTGGGAAAGGAGAVAGAAGSTAVATANTALASSSTAATTGLTALTTAASAAAAALATISGSSAASDAAQFIDLGAFFAEGGEPPVGKVAVGGEKGTELFFPRTKTSAETARAVEALATGGAMRVKGAALIGQNGPQLFRPSVPGFILPADETAAILQRFPGFGGAFAGGGSPPVGRLSLGGERGTEAFIPLTRGMAPPSSDGGGGAAGGKGTTVVNQFTISGPVDRRTEQQIANAAGQGVQRAMARNS